MNFDRTPHASLLSFFTTPFRNNKSYVYYYETLRILAISYHSRSNSRCYRFAIRSSGYPGWKGKPYLPLAIYELCIDTLNTHGRLSHGMRVVLMKKVDQLSFSKLSVETRRK